MSTRFYRHVFIGDKLEEVQVIRDGFNVWMPEPPKGTEFKAHCEQIFGMDMWAYPDTVPCTNPNLILVSRTYFSGKFVRVMVGSPLEVHYFSRPEKKYKAAIVTVDAINAENERIAAAKRADAVALLPKSHRGFAFTENMNIITRSQLAAISARPDTSGFQEYFNLLADDIDAIAAALPKSRDLEKVELTGISRVIRKLVTR